MKKRYLIPLGLLLIGVLYVAWARLPKNAVPNAIGEAVSARPLPPSNVPAHPGLTEPQRSGMHGGSYNIDVSDYAGPLGVNTVSKHRAFGKIIGVTPNISFDKEGRIITVGLRLGSVELHLLDPDSLETLARYKMPKKNNRDNSGGAYFHLDAKDRPIIAPNDNSIKILDVKDDGNGPQWEIVADYSLGEHLPDGVNIHDVMPDWSRENLWFVTTGNIIGYRNQADGTYHTYTLPEDGEVVQNSFAVDQDGIYIVSTRALYMFEIDPLTRNPRPVWREAYDRGDIHKPGMIAHGSGTSPTLMGDDLISIVDDGSPRQKIMVYKRGKTIAGARMVCAEPIFKAGSSATENSLVAYGNAMIVQNDYGHDYQGNALKTAPGVSRVDVRDDRSGCDTIWESDLRSQSLPRLSTATGLVYIYTFKLPFEGAKTGGWYMTALDFNTGEQLWDRLIGTGSGGFWDKYSSVTAPVVIGPNGAAYVGIRTGIISVKDGPP